MSKEEIQNSVESQKSKVEKKVSNDFRGIVKPIIEEIFKESEAFTKTQSFAKTIDITESDVQLINKRIDSLKKVFDVADSNCENTNTLKIQKLIDKAIVAALKYEYTQEDAEVVVKTLKKEVAMLKSEVNKAKKLEQGSKREFEF